MRQRLVFVVAIAFACGPWAFAQGSGQSASQSTPNNPSGTNAQAGSNSNAIVTQYGSVIDRQFVSAAPGVFGTPGVFPGLPMPSAKWALYYSAVQHRWTTGQIERMRRKFHFGDVIPLNWKKRIRATPTEEESNLPPSNDNPIDIVPWWAYSIAYANDHEIGRVDALCDPLEPEEVCLGLALAEAKHLTHTSRVSIRARVHEDGITDGLSVGGSGNAARITDPTQDNNGVAIAAGALIGRNRTKAVDYDEFDIICLNDGPTNPPQPLEQPRQARIEPPPSQPPSVQTVRVELAPIKIEVEATPIRFEVPTLPLQQIHQLPPVPAPPPAEEACDARGMPDFTVLFDFDKSLFKPEYLPKVKEFVSWLGTHPKCHIQVEGHTCKSGTFDYDAALGRRRAKAVYDQLIANGGKPEQIEQFVSVSKDRIAFLFESDPLNRRVILRIIGPASGK